MTTTDEIIGTAKEIVGEVVGDGKLADEVARRAISTVGKAGRCSARRAAGHRRDDLTMTQRGLA